MIPAIISNGFAIGDIRTAGDKLHKLQKNHVHHGRAYLSAEQAEKLQKIREMMAELMESLN
jgi:hypothetical protein